MGIKMRNSVSVVIGLGLALSLVGCSATGASIAVNEQQITQNPQPQPDPLPNDPHERAIQQILSRNCVPQTSISSDLVYEGAKGVNGMRKYLVKMNNQAGELTTFLSPAVGNQGPQWSLEILTQVDNWGCSGYFYYLDAY
jgi:hypothetical protein